MKLEVGMYVRGKYYNYRGKIGKIIKNYNNDLEIAYTDGILKTTTNSFIDDNFDIDGRQYVASFNIIDLIKKGDYVNGVEVIEIYEKGTTFKESSMYSFKEKTIENQNIIINKALKLIEQSDYKEVDNFSPIHIDMAITTLKDKK